MRPNLDAEFIPALRGETIKRRIEPEFAFAHRGVDFDIGHARPNWRTGQPDVAAQAAALDRALDHPCRIRVVVREQYSLERHGDDEQAERVFRARLADLAQVDLAAGKADLAGFLAVDIDDRE